MGVCGDIIWRRECCDFFPRYSGANGREIESVQPAPEILGVKIAIFMSHAREEELSDRVRARGATYV